MKKIIAAFVVLAALSFFVPIQHTQADCILAIVPQNSTAATIQAEILHSFRNYVMVCTQKEYEIFVQGKKYFPVIVFRDPTNSKDVFCIDPNEIPGYKREQFLNLVSNEVNATNITTTILVVAIPPLFALLILFLDKSERKPLRA